MRRLIYPMMIALTSCALIKPITDKHTLVLRPEIQKGHITQGAVTVYDQNSIAHLKLELWTLNGSVESALVTQRTLLQSQLGNPIVFTNLKANTSYRVKAIAYADLADTQVISSNDSDSYTDIPLLTDDAPSIATLKVKLIDRSFNGQASSSIDIISGEYSPIGTEQLAIPVKVSTLVGVARSPGYADGLGTAARLNYAFSLTIDPWGYLYLADTNNQLIRKISPAGFISTFAGKYGVTATNDGQGTSAGFCYPYDVAVDAAGNSYVADTGNCLIRKITPGGLVSTLAGAPATGSVDGQGNAARFNLPRSITIDHSNNILVSDTNNHTIRKITPGGMVTTVAGLAGTPGGTDGVGSSARFYYPHGIAVDAQDNIYVADHTNNTIRKITAGGVVTTLAGYPLQGGSSDGQGSNARFIGPIDLAIDATGNVFVTDHYNHTLREITPGGYVSTFAGLAGASGSVDGVASAARFYMPNGLTMDAFGTLYVSDYYNYTVRKIQQ